MERSGTPHQRLLFQIVWEALSSGLFFLFLMLGDVLVLNLDVA